MKEGGHLYQGLDQTPKGFSIFVTLSNLQLARFVPHGLHDIINPARILVAVAKKFNDSKPIKMQAIQLNEYETDRYFLSYKDT